MHVLGAWFSLIIQEFCVISTASSYAEEVITASDKNDSKLNPNDTTAGIIILNENNYNYFN